MVSEINDKNPINRYGDTPLHLAAKNGYLEIVKCIMDNIDDKSPKDNQGRTPLHLAAKYNQIDVCKYIVAVIDDKNPEDFYIFLRYKEG